MKIVIFLFIFFQRGILVVALAYSSWKRYDICTGRLLLPCEILPGVFKNPFINMGGFIIRSELIIGR